MGGRSDVEQMNHSWQVRAATQKDTAGLAQCMESAYSIYQDRMKGERLPPMDIDYAAEIANYPTWVVESDEGDILGGLIMVFEDGQASIANIAVDPRSQGQGIGGALMKLAEEQARSRGFSEIHLATHSLLQENVSLYLHLGWKESGRQGVRILMKKEI